MDEKKTETRTDTRGGIEKRDNNISLDMGEEFRQSFDHAALTSRYIEQAIRYTVETNPLERVIVPIQSAPDDVKKESVDRTKKCMQIWLDTYEAMLTEGKNLSVDLIGIAADVARIKRKKLK